MRRIITISILCLLTAALYAQQTYTLTVNTLPQGLGEPYITAKGEYKGTYTAQIPAGSNATVSITDIVEGWKVADWRFTQGNANISAQSADKVLFTMPAEDVTLTIVMEYSPNNPDNPLSSHWYEDSGLMVIDIKNG